MASEIAQDAVKNTTSRRSDEDEQERARNRERWKEADSYPKRHRILLTKPAHFFGAASEKAEELMDMVKRDALIVLCGPRGTGKTQMGVWWARERCKIGLKPGLYVKAADLAEELKASWDERNKTETSVLKKYRMTPYLVIDEIGECGNSEWEQKKLVNLIDHRYDSMLVTILITNEDRNTLTDSLGDSIVSRLAETGVIVNCGRWDSYRNRKEKE